MTKDEQALQHLSIELSKLIELTEYHNTDECPRLVNRSKRILDFLRDYSPPK